MSIHPYRSLPASNFWSRAVATPGAHEVDPMTGAPFMITQADQVGTMGSCFAQHLSRFLQRSGLNYFVPEGGEQDQGYGVFSARYGNVYTVRQAVQLFDRAYGAFAPLDEAWRSGDRWVDPFRPQVEPRGFATQTDVLADRERHLAAVRKVFEESSVLVFTLGLTEGWRDRRDGAMYPVVPGASGGEFNPDRHEFVNFTAAEVTEDLLGRAVSTISRELRRNCDRQQRYLLKRGPANRGLSTGAPTRAPRDERPRPCQGGLESSWQRSGVPSRSPTNCG